MCDGCFAFLGAFLPRERLVYIDRPVYVEVEKLVDRIVHVEKPVDRIVYIEKPAQMSEQKIPAWTKKAMQYEPWKFACLSDAFANLHCKRKPNESFNLNFHLDGFYAFDEIEAMASDWTLDLREVLLLGYMDHDNQCDSLHRRVLDENSCRGIRLMVKLGVPLHEGMRHLLREAQLFRTRSDRDLQQDYRNAMLKLTAFCDAIKAAGRDAELAEILSSDCQQELLEAITGGDNLDPELLGETQAFFILAILREARACGLQIRSFDVCRPDGSVCRNSLLCSIYYTVREHISEPDYWIRDIQKRADVYRQMFEVLQAWRMADSMELALIVKRLYQSGLPRSACLTVLHFLVGCERDGRPARPPMCGSFRPNWKWKYCEESQSSAEDF
ncbi:unnamed protein product [Effrenium voratum]|nr:unnamed protein product [Effrenium voratum]